MKKKIVLGMLLLSLCLAGNAFATETTWSGIEGDADDWVDGANWDNGVPVDNTFEVVISSGTAIPYYLPEGRGNLKIDDVGTDSDVLANTVTVSGTGTLKVDHEWGVAIGGWANSTGRLIQTGDSSVEIAASLGMAGGRGDDSRSSYGEYLMSGGSLTANKITIAGEGTGYMEVTGGSNVSALGPANGENASVILGYYPRRAGGNPMPEANGTLAVLGSGSTIEFDSFATCATNSDDKFVFGLDQRTLRYGFDAGGTSMIDVVGTTFDAWRAGSPTAYLKGTLDVVDLGDAAPGTYTVMRADKIAIDGLNINTPGPEWSVELVGTGVRGDGLVDELQVSYKSSSPIFNMVFTPANHAEDVATTVILEWTEPNDIVDPTYDVYLDPNMAKVIASNEAVRVSQGQSGLTCDPPGDMAIGTDYYWKVAVHGGDPDPLNCRVMHFTTITPKAICVSPLDEATNVAANTDLSWMAGAGAGLLSHNVYFSDAAETIRDGAPYDTADTAVSVLDAAINGGDLDWNTTYYWAVDEVYNSGTVAGDVWTFDVGSPVCSEPLPGDANGNCILDLEDIALIAQRWLDCTLANGTCP